MNLFKAGAELIRYQSVGACEDENVGGESRECKEEVVYDVTISRL